jgi:hypothetical protein
MSFGRTGLCVITRKERKGGRKREILYGQGNVDRLCDLHAREGNGSLSMDQLHSFAVNQ